MDKRKNQGGLKWKYIDASAECAAIKTAANGQINFNGCPESTEDWGCVQD
jgi:hypothetical protein